MYKVINITGCVGKKWLFCKIWAEGWACAVLQMCHLCGVLQKIKKMCVGEIKNTEVSALCVGKVVH